MLFVGGNVMEIWALNGPHVQWNFFELLIEGANRIFIKKKKKKERRCSEISLSSIEIVCASPLESVY